MRACTHTCKQYTKYTAMWFKKVSKIQVKGNLPCSLLYCYSIPMKFFSNWNCSCSAVKIKTLYLNTNTAYSEFLFCLFWNGTTIFWFDSFCSNNVYFGFEEEKAVSYVEDVYFFLTKELANKCICVGGFCWYIKSHNFIDITFLYLIFPVLVAWNNSVLYSIFCT